MASVLKRVAARNGDKTFLHYLHDGRKFSYREMDQLSDRIANGLVGIGVNKGTHVASLMDNSPEQVLLFLALGKLGAVSIPINTAARGKFLEYYLNQSDASALVVDAHLVEHVAEIREQTSLAQIVVFTLDPTASPSAEKTPGTIDFGQLLRGDPAPPAVEVAFSDLALISYTSGTTGPSKGNMLSQAAQLNFGLNVPVAQRATEDDIYYMSFPMFHLAAWSSCALAMLQVGGAIALTRSFSARNFLPDVRRSNATMFNMMSVAGFLLSQPPTEADRDHRLRIGLAVPMPSSFEEFERRFGVTLVGAYGLSDFGGAFAVSPEEAKERRWSVGPVLPDIEARIVDDDDVEVPIGESGELVLRHRLPWMTPYGYYKMPEATVAAYRNLWFHTGDRFYRDADGYYYFVDRKKDAIRRRGENISTFEVESIISSHVSVIDVAVYAVSAPGGEDDVAVSVVLDRDANLSEQEILEYCKKNLPRFMIPRYVHFASELPRTLTLKVKKQELRAAIEARPEEFWDRERSGNGRDV